MMFKSWRVSEGLGMLEAVKVFRRRIIICFNIIKNEFDPCSKTMIYLIIIISFMASFSNIEFNQDKLVCQL